MILSIWFMVEVPAKRGLPVKEKREGRRRKGRQRKGRQRKGRQRKGRDQW